jgi:hypothetical protein
MHSQLLSVRRLLKDNQFRPAKVQRQYVWDVSQCETFHHDLVEAFNAPVPVDYYLGPVILAEDEKDDLVWVYDGQQRLTTLTIYLAALAQVCTDMSGASQKARALARADTKDGARPRIDLRTRGGALTRVVRGGHQFRTSSQNMPVDWRIYSIEKRLLELLRQLPSPDAFFRWLQDHVVLNVLWTRPDTGLVLFDRANNRGIHLEWFELVKSILTAAGGADLKLSNGKTLEEFWYETERDAKQEFSDLIGSSAFIRYGKFDSSSALEGFEEEFDLNRDDGSLASSVRDYFQDLAHYRRTSSRLQGVINRRDPLDSEADLIRLQLLFLEYPHWKSLLMIAEAKGIDGDKELEFLRRLRRIAFVAHLLGWPAWTVRLTETFGKAIRELQEGFEKGAGVAADLIAFNPEQLAQARGVLSASLMDPSYYRPLVKLYESQRAFREGLLIPRTTFFAQIEHILPRAARGDWCTAFPDEDERADMTNRLGNLCLLSKDDNTASWNHAWRYKRAVYASADKTFVGALEAAGVETWTPEVVRHRTRDIAEAVARLLEI